MTIEVKEATPRRPSIGPIRHFGRFTLIKKLATGGMAEIWLARQKGLAGFNRFVVIKRILSHLAEEETFVKMFFDEARMSSQLTHPNIVQVYDLGQADDAYFIAMEYIAGENLSAIAWQAVRQRKPIAATLAARIVAQACKGLHYAHQLRDGHGRPLYLVHRDVSPQNILVTYTGEVKLVDFGIAKAASTTQRTRTGMLKGKFSYMSPEQCLGESIDRRSDVFSLGVVLYELAAGKRLFKHDSELMILEMITKRRVVPPSHVADGIPPALDAIVLKALEKSPEDRYQTAQEMQTALESFLNEQTTASDAATAGTYMHALFADRMNEKRRICELASREDVIAQAEVAQSQPPTRLVTEPSTEPRPFIAESVTAPPSQDADAHESIHRPGNLRTSWPQWLIAIALLTTAFASAYLFARAPALRGGITEIIPRPVGFLRIDSDPSGAEIYVNGKQIQLEDGSTALTPIEQLTPLTYGTHYSIRLEKAGHRPYIETIRMGPDVDGRALAPVLEPIPGKLVVEVQPNGPDEVEMFFNNALAGAGLYLEKPMPPGFVAVKARATGYRCNPVGSTEYEVRAGETTRVEIHCQKRARRPTRRRAVTPPKAACPSGCCPLPDQAPGQITLWSEPYAVVYRNGRRIGETPLNRHPLPAGCIYLEARHPPTGRSKVIKITVEPNKNLRYRFRFD